MPHKDYYRLVSSEEDETSTEHADNEMLTMYLDRTMTKNELDFIKNIKDKNV